jgi:hypothetical protein
MEPLSGDRISLTCQALHRFLLEKNRRYRDSALNPNHFFSKLPPSEGIRVRIDDKLNRILNSSELRKNDVVDLLGYLVLLCCSEGWTDFDDLLD